jgi:hypothetical protein
MLDKEFGGWACDEIVRDALRITIQCYCYVMKLH